MYANGPEADNLETVIAYFDLKTGCVMKSQVIWSKVTTRKPPLLVRHNERGTHIHLLVQILIQVLRQIGWGIMWQVVLKQWLHC